MLSLMDGTMPFFCFLDMKEKGDREMRMGKIEPGELPWDISGAVGEVKEAEALCPGVYYVVLQESMDGSTEAYLVDRNTDAVSHAAKTYGQPVEDIPDCLIFPFEKKDGGRRIVEYELQRYYVKFALPNADSRELREAAAYGMELYPEYFGLFPPSVDTPLGHTVRYKVLMNGVFWIETDKGKNVLAIAYPRWLDVFSAYVMRFALHTGRDDEENTDAMFAYLYFPETAFPVALFELQRYYPEFRDSPYIHTQALMNVIYRDFLDYAASFNLLEQTGGNDTLGLLLRAAGDEEARGSAENVITATVGAGFDYLRL